MPDYRRNRIPDGTYFFTVNLPERRLSIAAGGCRLFGPPESDQDRIRQIAARNRTSDTGSPYQRRTRYLATTVPGAYDARRL